MHGCQWLVLVPLSFRERESARAPDRRGQREREEGMWDGGETRAALFGLTVKPHNVVQHVAFGVPKYNCDKRAGPEWEEHGYWATVT